MDGMIKKAVPGSVRALIKQLMHICGTRLARGHMAAAWILSALNNTQLFISEFIPVISADGRGLSLPPSCIINTPLQLVDLHSGALWHVDGPLCRQN